MSYVKWETIGDELLAVGAYWYEEAGTGVKLGDHVKVLWLLGFMCMRDFCNPVMGMLDRGESVWGGVGDQIWRRDYLAENWISIHYLDKVLYRSTIPYLEMCDPKMRWWGILDLDTGNLAWK